MAEQDKKISELTSVSSISASDLALATISDPDNVGEYLSRKITEGNKATSYLNTFEFPLLLNTTDKSIIGAINELNDNMPADIEDVEFPTE